MKLYSLNQLAENSEFEIADEARKAIASGGFPETARFAIRIRQVLI
jgi:hypothetical protein